MSLHSSPPKSCHLFSVNQGVCIFCISLVTFPQNFPTGSLQALMAHYCFEIPLVQRGCLTCTDTLSVPLGFTVTFNLILFKLPLHCPNLHSLLFTSSSQFLLNTCLRRKKVVGIAQCPASGDVSSHPVYLRNETMFKSFICSIIENVSLKMKQTL